MEYDCENYNDGCTKGFHPDFCTDFCSDYKIKPPPRMVGHQTLFELVAKDNCLKCVFKKYCDNVHDDNKICNAVQSVNLWKPLSGKE